MRLMVGLIILWVGFHNTQAQPDGHSQEDSLRQRYIREFDDRFYLKPILTIRSLSLDLADEDNQVSTISYKPSSNNFLGLGLYLFGVGLEVSFKVPQNDKETPPEIFGETESFDFQTNIYAKKWGGDISYQRYQGLFMDNPEKHIDTWQNGDPYPVRDDLELKYFQANGFYVLNHSRFSYRSPYIQADQQLKNQGSVQVGLFFSHFEFSADSTLIPESAQSTFPENAGLRHARITTIAILPGYTYTFTWRNIYLNAALAAGPGVLWIKFNRSDSEEQEVKIRPVANLRAALGYNGNWFFTGVTAVSQLVSGRIDNLDVNSNSANIKLFFGVRFKERGFLKKRIFDLF